MYQASGVEGIIIGPDGNPLANTEIMLHASYGYGQRLFINPTTNEHGTFSTLSKIPATLVALEIEARLRDEGIAATYTWSSDPLEFVPGHVMMLGEITLSRER